MEDLMDDMVNSLNSVDDYEIHEDINRDILIIMSDNNLIDRAMKMGVSINTQSMVDLMLEIMIGEEYPDIVQFLSSGNEQLRLSATSNEKPQQSWGIPGLTGWSGGGRGGKRKRVVKKGGGGAFELLVVKILFKLFSEIPSVLEKWGDGKLNARGQALWSNENMKKMDEATLRILRQMFKPYFVGDRVYAGTASDLRKMLRVQYPTVVTRVQVAKDEFPDYANDTTYSRRNNVQSMDENNKILKYTHGDILFDSLLKVGVAKDLGDTLDGAPEKKERFLNALSTKFGFKRRRGNSSTNAMNNSNNSRSNSQKIQAYPNNVNVINSTNNGRWTSSQNVNNTKVNNANNALYRNSTNTNNTKTNSDQNQKTITVVGGKRKAKK